MIKYDTHKQFDRDLKKLAKRFPSLLADFKRVKKNVIELNHILQIDNHSIFEIPGFSTNNFSIWKIKKFACQSLKGRGNRSGLRVIYGWCHHDKKVTFLEIYFKGDKENEDRERIKEFVKNRNLII